MADVFSPYDDIFRRYMGEEADNDELLAIIAATTKAESGWDAGNRTGDNGHSWGLFQMHDQGAGTGMGAARLDPDQASAVMVPQFVKHYYAGKRQGLAGAELASYVARMAERPQGYEDPRGRAAGKYKENWHAVVGGAGMSQEGMGGFAGGVITTAQIADLARRHGGEPTMTVVDEYIDNPNATPAEKLRADSGLGSIKIRNPNPKWNVVFPDGTEVQVKGQRDADGNATGAWIPTGGDVSALRPGPADRRPPRGRIMLDRGDGTRIAMHLDENDDLVPETYPDGSPVIDYGGRQPPRGRTQAQEDASNASAILSLTRAANVGRPTPLDPITAQLRGAQTQRAEIQALKDAQALIPKQIRLLQEYEKTLDYIHDQVATGAMSMADAEKFRGSAVQMLDAGMRGSTPADEEKERQKNITERAQLGANLLQNRVTNVSQLSGNLFRDYRELFTGNAGFTKEPYEFNPLAYARALTEEMGGGPEISELAKILVGATNPNQYPAPTVAGAGALAAPTAVAAPLPGEERETDVTDDYDAMIAAALGNLSPPEDDEEEEE